MWLNIVTSGLVNVFNFMIWLRRIAISSVFVLVVCSLALPEPNQKVEAYPFFNWDLFSFIPNERTEFTIEISRYGDEVYNPPLKFSEAGFIFRNVNASPTEYTPIIRQLAWAIQRNDRSEIDLQQDHLEKAFAGLPYSFRLLEVNIDPVDYYKTGHYEIVSLMGTYESH